jgi:paired small multidrug resistance pump
VLGALGVMLSLLFGAFNVSAFFMEVAWMLIGIYGIARSARVRRELKSATQNMPH